MEQPALSHELRCACHQGLDRQGPNWGTIAYLSFASHVPTLLDEAVYGVKHLRLSVSEAGSAGVA